MPVASSITDQRTCKNRQDQRDPGRQGNPRCRDDHFPPAGDHVSPARSRRLNAKAEEREPALEQDRVAHTQRRRYDRWPQGVGRSEEHTTELQSPCNLVCRLLLEKKKSKSSRR